MNLKGSHIFTKPVNAIFLQNTPEIFYTKNQGFINWIKLFFLLFDPSRSFSTPRRMITGSMSEKCNGFVKSMPSEQFLPSKPLHHEGAKKKEVSQKMENG